MSIRILEIRPNGTFKDITERELKRGCAVIPSDPVNDARMASVKKDSTVPKVGDTVRFNDYGLEQCFGSAFGKQAMKRLEMKVIQVGSVSLTYPEPTFEVEVDDPEINMLLIDNACFDIVKR